MSRTILLADDSLTIQKVVELTFADTEYEVVAVSSGDELMQRLPELRPDLVICDVIMPGRDGYDVCQEIKSSSEYLHLPVILLTGTFEPFDRDRAVAVGCSEIITKPFEAKKLVDAVERLASTPGAPPPTAADTQSIGPDDLTEAEGDVELDDTEVSSEFGPAEGVAEESAVEEAVVAAPEVDSESGQAQTEPVSEAPAGEFELGGVDDSLELELPDLPEVEPPPDVGEETEESADPARTLAVEDFSELMEQEGTEVTMETEGTAVPEDSLADSTAQDEPFPTEEPTPDEAVPEPSEEPDQSLTTPIDVSAVGIEPEPEVEFTLADDVEAPTDTRDDDADTQDFSGGPPVETAPSEENGGLGLSDEDVDRIARRLLELAGDRIEHIAWDVIPDMAEVMVRERMREIEAEAERTPS
jgi:CheY-like chemotaxis protein